MTDLRRPVPDACRAVIDVDRPARRVSDVRVAAAVLAAPFLAMVAALQGMTIALPIFHGTDEVVYHYPTILRFAHELPFPDLHAYPAAQTPLYHVLMAYIGKAIGFELWRLRLVQVLISYALALAVWRLLRRRLRMAQAQALVLALLFAISAYVFGQSFRLGTDNLALLLSVLAIDRLAAFGESDGLGTFAAACALICAAVLTRQSTAFLVAVALLSALRPRARLTGPARAIAVVLALASLAPAAALFVSWHGLVPVGGDPSSCGLCVRRGDGTGIATSGLTMQTLEIALAALGVYGVILFAPVWIEARRELVSGRTLARGLGAALCGIVLLVAFPARPGAHAAGSLWDIASHLPVIGGSSLLFWVFVPVAGAVLALRLPVAPRPGLTAAIALSFGLSTIAIRFPWEKYTDPVALLVILLTVRRRELNSPVRLAGAAVLAVLFVAYTAYTAAHVSAYPVRTVATTRPH